jgi:hypothetical protein
MISAIIAHRSVESTAKEIRAMANPIIPRRPFRVGNLSLGQCVAMMAGIFVVVIAVYVVFSALWRLLSALSRVHQNVTNNLLHGGRIAAMEHEVIGHRSEHQHQKKYADHRLIMRDLG